jgi:V/A-type H+-transporting ATPase subunit I
LPEDVHPIELPERDLPTVRAQAKEVDDALAADTERLSQLARLVPEIARERARLSGQAEFAAAANGALAGDDLWAVQGWVPAKDAPSLAEELTRRGIRAGVDSREPTEQEEPPTLIEYPRLVRPIKGLFDILGTVAGYKEFDVSIPFMIALPIFAAMLIGDGAYGAILLFGPLLLYGKATKALGVQFTRLLMVIGAAALAWGVLNGSFFGVVLYKPLIPVNMSDASRSLVMRISFCMAAVHLSLAQLWRAVALWPSLKALGRLGWAIFIWGMLGVVLFFVMNRPLGAFKYPLIVGAALAILFEAPSWNPLKMLGLGLANFPLSMLSAFSDVISYVRLMAVGLASGVMAASFNQLALSTGNWALAVPILVFGHALNLGLALIAIFAHGVRLNMLEFSNNLGMEWVGRGYQPFAKPIPEEIQT